MARKGNIFEWLSPYAAPADEFMMLDILRRQAIASMNNQRQQILDYTSVMKLFNVTREIDLGVLAMNQPAMGMVKSGSHWTLDAKRFDAWASGRMSVLRRRFKPRDEQPATVGGSNLF